MWRNPNWKEGITDFRLKQIRANQSEQILYKDSDSITLLFILEFKKFLKRFYLFLGREKEGGKHQCVVASYAPPSGDVARNPGMCPNWESNRRHFGSQGGTESTEPHQPGAPLSSLCTNRGKALGFQPFEVTAPY